MAWMNQERKGQIAAELKRVMPKDWKYSLAVRHHSTIVLTIASAPVDLLATYREKDPNVKCADVNHYWLQNQFSGELLETFEKIKGALNAGNWDKSDIQTDYHNVGWYVDINIGKWDKPFVYTGGK